MRVIFNYPFDKGTMYHPKCTITLNGIDCDKNPIGNMTTDHNGQFGSLCKCHFDDLTAEMNVEELRRWWIPYRTTDETKWRVGNKGLCVTFNK